MNHLWSLQPEQVAQFMIGTTAALTIKACQLSQIFVPSLTPARYFGH
jgi:hypothetical protein